MSEWVTVLRHVKSARRACEAWLAAARAEQERKT